MKHEYQAFTNVDQYSTSTEFPYTMRTFLNCQLYGSSDNHWSSW